MSINHQAAVMNHRLVDPRSPLPSPRGATRRGALAGLSALPVLAALAGCGFELRKAPVFAFQSIAITGRGKIVALLRRSLQGSGTVQVVDVDPDPKANPPQADAVLETGGEQRSRLVLSTDAVGAVRELELALTFRFRVVGRGERELLAPAILIQRRDLTYNETNAIAKESESELLYADMQADIAQQVIRRLGAIRQL